jgi:hypothetical protein
MFLTRHSTFSLAPVAITSFSLYSSEFAGGVPNYRLQRTFPLVGTNQVVA